jgi:CheY-like chemotaxis protein
VVDDDPAVRDFLVGALRTRQRGVLTAASGEEALQVLAREAVDLVLLDLSMPGLDGVETFREIQARRPGLPVVIVTGYPDSDLVARALEIGPVTMVSKPVDLPQIQKVVEQFAGA